MDVRPAIAAPLGDVLTDRLDLRRPVSTDAELLAPVFAKSEVWEFPFGRGMDAPWTAAFVTRAIEHWSEHGFGLWVVRNRADGNVIGYLGLSMPAFLAEAVPASRMPAVEVGWRLDPDAWGHGYASEGATAALGEAFETLELAEVCSAPQNINPRSARVAERIGMAREGRVPLGPTDARGAVDIDLYWMTRADWLTRGRG